MKIIDLVVDRIIVSFNERSKDIVIFKQDDESFFGLKAPAGVYSAGQLVPVLMSRDGESISWPPKVTHRRIA